MFQAWIFLLSNHIYRYLTQKIIFQEVLIENFEMLMPCPPNVIHFGRKSRFGPDQFILVVTILFWSRPNHYGQVQINLVRPKPFWTDQNCFGHIVGQDIIGLRKYFG